MLGGWFWVGHVLLEPLTLNTRCSTANLLTYSELGTGNPYTMLKFIKNSVLNVLYTTYSLIMPINDRVEHG